MTSKPHVCCTDHAFWCYSMYELLRTALPDLQAWQLPNPIDQHERIGLVSLLQLRLQAYRDLGLAPAHEKEHEG